MREIKLHNTLSGKVERLSPRDSGKVGIYVCGPTVYARIHVGNARPFVMFALLKRFLEQEGYQVTLVENITDVNDKIYQAANRAGVPSADLAKEMTRHYTTDTDGLGLGRPDREPLASETMEQIVSMIEALVELGHAYEAGGDVYFRVRSYEKYGQLSNRSLEDITSVEEQEEEGLKADPLDFALWKAQKEGEDTSWDSPWGKGRPGWHIECSVMAEEILGLDFDIHGGGMDLIFPHHENEIAQTEAARDRALARVWMHNGMIRLGEEKMAKSEGNIQLLSDALESYGQDVLVMYFIGGHYRRPLTFSTERLDEAKSRLERVADFCRKAVKARWSDGADAAWLTDRSESFLAALADDFNTPQALAELFDAVSEGNKLLAGGEPLGGELGQLEGMLYCLGLESLLARDEEPIDEEARELLERRERARKDRDYEAADRARERIEELGYELRDTSAGPELIRKS